MGAYAHGAGLLGEPVGAEGAPVGVRHTLSLMIAGSQNEAVAVQQDLQGQVWRLVQGCQQWVLGTQ